MQIIGIVTLLPFISVILCTIIANKFLPTASSLKLYLNFNEENFCECVIKVFDFIQENLKQAEGV